MKNLQESLEFNERETVGCCFFFRLGNCMYMQKSIVKGGLIMEIRRDFYLKQLIKRKNNGLIKVINLWRKTHTLACGMKATFHLIYT